MKKYYEPDKVDQAVPREPAPGETRAQYLRPGELLSRMDECPVMFQPIGTLEWHGRHNPIGCDALKAERLCCTAAELGGGVVAPPLYFSSDAYRDIGHGYGLGMDAAAGFQLPGSFYHAPPELFTALLKNCCANYLSRGFRLVVLVSGHNPPIQKNLMDEVCYRFKTDEGKEPVVAVMEFEPMPEDDPRRHSDHAGGYETSMMLHLFPERVNLDANRGGGAGTPADAQQDPLLGVGENPKLPLSKASAREGQERFELQVTGLVDYAKEKLSHLNG